MGLLKDWTDDHNGYTLRSKLKYFFSPKVWLQLHKWRKQRADRGWSDRDTWGAGDHIAQITADMLQHLNDYAYTDWPEWFKLNVKEDGKGAYKNLKSVIDDINAYLEFEKTTWADGLTTRRDSIEEVFEKREDGHYTYKGPIWVDDKGKDLTDAAVMQRIKKWRNEEIKLYKKATKAMGFFARHFSSFWD